VEDRTNPLVTSADADQLAVKTFAAKWEVGKVPSL
jgi:hypothetical protein